MVREIERLIQLDEQETARQRDRVASLALAAAVIEALPDALVVVDLTGNIVLVNERAELLFGYPRSDLFGRPVEILIPRHLREQHANHRAEYNQFTLSTQTRAMGQGLQLSGVRSDGHVFPAEILMARVTVPRGIYNVAVVRHSSKVAHLEFAMNASFDAEFRNDEVNAGH